MTPAQRMTALIAVRPVEAAREIRAAIKATGTVKAAAKLLGVSRAGLYVAMSKLGLGRKGSP